MTLFNLNLFKVTFPNIILLNVFIMINKNIIFRKKAN